MRILMFPTVGVCTDMDEFQCNLCSNSTANFLIWLRTTVRVLHADYAHIIGSSLSGSTIPATGLDRSPLVGFQDFISTVSANVPQNSIFSMRVMSAPKFVSTKSCKVVTY